MIVAKEGARCLSGEAATHFPPHRNSRSRSGHRHTWWAINTNNEMCCQDTRDIMTNFDGEGETYTALRYCHFSNWNYLTNSENNINMHAGTFNGLIIVS